MKAEETLSAALPQAVRQILGRLEGAGFEAYAVGGCVRNVLLGRQVHDWDLCSAASPRQVTDLFSDCRVLPSGVEHGTVTILWDNCPFELTMFRTESDYDGRKPHCVRPARRIEDDLKRRDFTINAMAYSPLRGLLDCHGGQEDLSAGLLRAVGQPELRFREDHLRILRALRFAACYGLQMERQTEAALYACAPGLKHLSGERVWQELSRLLLGEGAGAVLAGQGRVLHGLGEEWKDFHFSAAEGQALDKLPVDVAGRLAFLLAALPRRSRILETMKCPADIKTRTARIWAQADSLLKLLPNQEDRAGFYGWLSAFERRTRAVDGESALALVLGQGRLSTLPPTWKQQPDVPLDLCDLAVSGGDLLAAAVPAGKAVGQTLRWLLEAVWAGKVENQRDRLLELLSQEAENEKECRKKKREKDLL